VAAQVNLNLGKRRASDSYGGLQINVGVDLCAKSLAPEAQWRLAGGGARA